MNTVKALQKNYPNVYAKLHDFLSDDEIESSTSKELFGKWLLNEGILGYTNSILTMLDALLDVRAETLNDLM